MGIFDRLNSKNNDSGKKNNQKQQENLENNIIKQQRQQNIKEGKKILKKIMGGSMVHNISFTQKMTTYGISAFKLNIVWEKINRQIKKELEEGSLEAGGVSARIDELLVENSNPEQMEKNAQKARDNAQKAQINAMKIKQQEELRDQKDRQKALKIGITGFDFKCHLHEQRMNSQGGQEKTLLDGYCFVQEDKLVIKKSGMWIKSQMGDKIIPYSNITAIDFDKAGKFHLTSSIVISISSFESVILKNTTESNFKLLYEAWLKFNNSLNQAKMMNNTPQTSNADELIKYAQLYQQGLLTREEFEAKKKELL